MLTTTDFPRAIPGRRWAEEATGAKPNVVGSNVGYEIRGACFRGSWKRITVEGDTEVFGGCIFPLG